METSLTYNNRLEALNCARGAVGTMQAIQEEKSGPTFQQLVSAGVDSYLA